METQVFAIAPAGTRPLLILAPVMLLVLIPVIALLGTVLVGVRGARFEVSPEGLRLRGDFYGRLIPAAELQPEGAVRVDFGATPGLTPRRRTFGTGLPGYQAGWFRLQNGQTALVYLTDRARTVYVPTTAGYGVLVTPEDPDGFVAALRTAARR
jgi:hypothetical protein